MVNLQKERSQKHQKANFRTKKTSKTVLKKECQSGNIIKWVFQVKFFQKGHINAISLFEDLHCAFGSKKLQARGKEGEFG